MTPGAAVLSLAVVFLFATIFQKLCCVRHTVTPSLHVHPSSSEGAWQCRTTSSSFESVNLLSLFLANINMSTSADKMQNKSFILTPQLCFYMMKGWLTSGRELKSTALIYPHCQNLLNSVVRKQIRMFVSTKKICLSSMRTHHYTTNIWWIPPVLHTVCASASRYGFNSIITLP